MKFCLLIAFASVLISTYGQSRIYHSENSKLPDTLYVHGKIEKISGGFCGLFCVGGVIKVLLKKPVQGYTNQYVYLVTACLSNKVNVNTQVNVIATKLMKTDKECYYQSINNQFKNSKMAFYKLSEEETRKIH